MVGPAAGTDNFRINPQKPGICLAFEFIAPDLQHFKIFSYIDFFSFTR